MSQLNTKQTPIYGNTKVLGPDGELLFLCLPKKAHWYLDRDLAKIVTEEPMVIQLTFEPKGRGQNGDAYALGEKLNKCAVCGTEEDLTRHHIVPYTYRKHFPEIIKSHNSHDIVPICVSHHSEYEEDYAIELKYIFAKQYDAPLESETKLTTDLTIVVKYAKLLTWHLDKLPYHRKKHMIKVIRDYHGPINKIQQVLSIYAFVDLNKSKTDSHGQIVVEHLITNDTLQWFVETWREHFINSMDPKFMPEHWDIHRAIGRE
jgi:hypothetical protein